MVVSCARLRETRVPGTFDFVEFFGFGRLGNRLVTDDGYERSSKKSVSLSLYRDGLHSGTRAGLNRTGYSRVLER
jgi:hypothetical protein